VCLHIPDQPALLRVLDGNAGEATLGRDRGNSVAISHLSVSRRHAAIRRDGSGWWIEDLGSTNCVRVGGHTVTWQRLKHGDWFSLGDVFCEFRLASDADLQTLLERAQQRRQASGAWLGRLEQAPDRDALMANLMTSIVHLAECRRGFLLTGNLDRGFATAACFNMQPNEPGSRQFTGSTAVIVRAVHTLAPVLVSDPSALDWARGRPSVVAGGLRALVALPIMRHETLLGVAYADSDEPGKVFTELDQEILAAFTEQAALLLAARGLDESLTQIDSCIEADADGQALLSMTAVRWKVQV